MFVSRRHARFKQLNRWALLLPSTSSLMKLSMKLIFLTGFLVTFNDIFIITPAASWNISCLIMILIHLCTTYYCSSHRLRTWKALQQAQLFCNPTAIKENRQCCLLSNLLRLLLKESIIIHHFSIMQTFEL